MAIFVDSCTNMKESLKHTQSKRKRRAKRVRARIYGTAVLPRLTINVSNKRLFAQCIDDEGGKTLYAAADTVLASKVKHVKVDRAFEFGKKFADEAKKRGIEKVVFDRGYRAYHGRVKAFADGAREVGLKF